MSYLVFFFIIIFFLIIIEIFLNKVTKIGKKKFQWLIDSKDFEPNFDKKKLNFFIKNSFDKELGWIRKPNTFGEEKSFKGKSYFSIDKSGCRTNPNNNKKNLKKKLQHLVTHLHFVDKLIMMKLGNLICQRVKK